MVLRKCKEGQLYGITYVDHKTQCVFNGSTLGKEFSAKEVLERCQANNTNNEKHYQKSILISAKNIMNVESQDYLKNNPIDILLRIENTNDYIPNNLNKTRKEFKEESNKKQCVDYFQT